MIDARKEGTDAEFYGPAVWAIDDVCYYIGAGYDAIKYCPWCGKEINATALADSGEERMVENGGSV